MKKAISFAILLFAILLGNSFETRAAVTLGQIDDFEGGTTATWANGGAAPPLAVVGGGPTGASDDFLQVTADGVGPGSRLTVFNRNQWLGDYIGQGITAIEMDLKNFGASPLTIRLAFKQTTANGAPGYLSQGFTLAADASWHHAVFQLNPISLTPLGSPTAFNPFFTNGQAEFRLIHEVGATSLNGDVVTGQFGVDNIMAVPEPTSMALLSLPLALLWFRRHR
jgi:hypothetical protein